MGILDKISIFDHDKHMLPVRLGFKNVARDISALRHWVHNTYSYAHQWIQYLYRRQEDLARDVSASESRIESKIHDRLGKQMEEVRKDIDRIAERFEGKVRDSSLTHNELAKLKQHLHHLFSEYNRHITDLHTRIKKAEVSEQRIRELIKEELHQHQADRQTSQSSKMSTYVPQHKHDSQSNHHAEYQHPVRPLRHTADQLTPAQRQLLAILARSETSLSYNDIAAAYGKAPSTVKTVLHALRKSGVPLAESVDNGIKRFKLDENYRNIITQKRV